ncbi:MAG: AraC family transcriptional regulator [Deltaproteobacteria bacterium]|nr:AraC family transcriptional regulator [Deltaproteobacteria bacterium]
MDSDIMEMLVEALIHEKHPRPAPRQCARDLAVRQCLRLIEAHEQKPLSVMDLCRAAGVGRRMLEYAFQDRFGLSPKAYLLARRLNGVRAELKQPSGEPSVTHAANSWGFHHLSQFSAFYRRQFGELPSETIRGR